MDDLDFDPREAEVEAEADDVVGSERRRAENARDRFLLAVAHAGEQ